MVSQSRSENDFLNDPNYFIYEYAARQAGFFVDQNKPWRLVANMKSKAMVVAMRRRLIITEALLKTRDSILKSESFLNGLSGEESVIDLQYILDFVDYFRKEISFNDSKVADYKNTLLSYISKKYDVINDTNNKNLTGSLKFKELKIDDTDENKLTRALIDILLILEENKSVINFIFRSLENQQKVLSFIDKKFNTMSIKALVNLFSSVSSILSS